MGNRWKTVAKAAAITWITLITVEIGLRIFDHYVPLVIFYDSGYEQFRGKPGADDWSFPLNSQGFKDLEFTQKQADVFRIAVIGDSFAFSIVPYPYSFATRLEDLLGMDGDIEVLNLGIVGTGPQDYLDILVREGLPLSPDLVLVSFFIGNDLAQSRISPEPRPWYTYSHLASLMYYLVSVRPQQVEGFVPPGEGDFCDACPTYTREAYLEIEYNRSGIYDVGRHENLDRLIADAVIHLQEMDRILEIRGVEMVVMLIPDELQVNAALRQEVFETYHAGREPAIWDMAAPNERLAAALAAIDVPVIDLYPDLQQGEQYYRPQDTHLNIAGNERAAQVLAEALEAYIPNFP